LPLFFHFRRDLELEAQEQRVRQRCAEEKEHSLRILSLEELLKSMREQLEDSAEQNKELEAKFLLSLRSIGNHRRKLLALKTEQEREDIRSHGADFMVNLIFGDVPIAMKESECEELKTLLLTPEGRRVFAFQLNRAVSDSIGESKLTPIAFSQLSNILKCFFASCNHMSHSDTEAVRTDSARAHKARRKFFLLLLYSACVHIDVLVSLSNSHTQHTGASDAANLSPPLRDSGTSERSHRFLSAGYVRFLSGRSDQRWHLSTCSHQCLSGCSHCL
jgi:hypothetical protein